MRLTLSSGGRRAAALADPSVPTPDPAVPPAPSLDLQALLDEIGRRRARLARTVVEARPASPAALEALLASLHDRQPALLAHVRRVAQFAEGIALMLPVPDLARQHLVRAALLHDIGKLAMPATLMAKDGPLTPEELAVVRTHSTIGAEVIHGVPYLRSAAAVVAATHERWAGDGHPAGLAGDAIPMAARIIVVADAFDALRGAAVGDQDARERANAELVRHAGGHFDPDIVRAWLRASENVGC
jgi:HD-GYP domain-containing protein (c-di-GMP phosphodiesterase class II)